jgi:CheY-like chemotaxis protein
MGSRASRIDRRYECREGMGITELPPLAPIPGAYWMDQGRVGERPGNSILIVDDTVANLLAFSAILKKLQCRIVLARSGLEALRRTLNEDFTVILMDVRMPGMNGFEVAEVLRQRERTRNTPILFLSAYEMPPLHLVEGLVGGGVDFIPSPVDPDLLLRRLRAILKPAASETPADPSDPNLEKAPWMHGEKPPQEPGPQNS